MACANAKSNRAPKLLFFCREIQYLAVREEACCELENDIPAQTALSGWPVLVLCLGFGCGSSVLNVRVWREDRAVPYRRYIALYTLRGQFANACTAKLSHFAVK